MSQTDRQREELAVVDMKTSSDVARIRGVRSDDKLDATRKLVEKSFPNTPFQFFNAQSKALVLKVQEGKAKTSNALGELNGKTVLFIQITGEGSLPEGGSSSDHVSQASKETARTSKETDTLIAEIKKLREDNSKSMEKMSTDFDQKLVKLETAMRTEMDSRLTQLLRDAESKIAKAESKITMTESKITEAESRLSTAESRLTTAEKKAQKQESKLRQVIQFLVDSELKNSKGDGGPTDLSVRITVLSETLGMMGSLYGSMGPKAKQYFMLEEISLKQGMPAGSSGAGTGIVLLFSPTDRWMDSLGKPLLQALEG